MVEQDIQSLRERWVVKQSRNTEHAIGLTSEEGHGKDTFHIYTIYYILYIKELSE